MSILKKVTKKTKAIDTDFLGFYFPKELVSYLTLYSLATGRTKTSLVKFPVKNWIASKKEEFPVDDLLKIIAEKSFQTWENPVGKRDNFNTFKSLLRIELKNRKLDEYVDKVIELIEYEKNKKEG